MVPYLSERFRPLYRLIPDLSSSIRVLNHHNYFRPILSEENPLLSTCYRCQQSWRMNNTTLIRDLQR
jgi:hypothetical protein